MIIYPSLKYFRYAAAPLVITLALAASLIMTKTANAVSETTIGGSLVATIIPKEPGPNADVRINLAGYGFNLDESLIRWYINGAPVLDGVGKKSYQLSTGALGESTTVTIAVRTKTGRTIAKKIVFQPAAVDMVWEADTYVPPSYSGAHLPTSGSTVTVGAIPQLMGSDGQLTPSNELVFTWRRDYRNLVRESGIGKDSISFAAGLPTTSHTIEVTVTSPDNNQKAYQKVTIPVSNPEIVVYPYSPLVGPHYAKAITDNYRLTGQEESFKAEGYYFRQSEVENNRLLYWWQVDGKKARSAGGDSSLLNTARDIDQSGEVIISVQAASLSNQFVQAKTVFKALLEKSLFGL